MGYILPCEGAFVKMVEEMESLCVYGGIDGNWQVAKICHMSLQSAKSRDRNLALCQVM